MTEDELKKYTKEALVIIWNDCALKVISGKQYMEINKLFEERLKILSKNKIIN